MKSTILKDKNMALLTAGVLFSLLLMVGVLGQALLGNSLEQSYNFEVLPEAANEEEASLNRSDWVFEVINISKVEGLEKAGSIILKDAGYQVVGTGAIEGKEEQTNSLIVRKDMYLKVDGLIKDLEKYFDIVTVTDDLPLTTANVRLMLSNLK